MCARPGFALSTVSLSTVSRLGENEIAIFEGVRETRGYSFLYLRFPVCPNNLEEELFFCYTVLSSAGEMVDEKGEHWDL